MPRSSSYSHRKSSRSYSRDRDRDYKRRSSSDDDYYEKKRSHRRSRSPSSSSRSKLSYKSSRRRSNSSSDNDYYRRKKSSGSRKDKKSKKPKRTHRTPSASSSSSEQSTLSSKSRQQTKHVSPASLLEHENETKQMFDLNLLEGKITSDTLEDIECDKFQSKTFVSSSNSKPASQKVYIDLKKDTILVPATNEIPIVINDSLFHPNFLNDDTEKLEKWVKKLYSFRQRLLHNN